MNRDKKRSPRSFKRECAANPENVVFYGDDVLCQVAEDANSLPETRRYALAGLLARYALSPSRLGDGQAKRLLDAWLGVGAVEKFHELCILLERRERGMDADCLFRRFGQSLQCSIADIDMKAIESVVRPTVSADGFIPAFSSTAAYLLPFHFVGRRGATARVTDSFGTELPEWTRYLGELQDIKYDVVVDVRVEDCSQLTGDSLMLPLQLAAWRREGAMCFPQYSILRLYATGVLHGGRLGFVDTKEKESKVGEIDNALFVRPVDCSQGELDRRGQLRAGTSLEQCRSAIAEWAETMTVCDPSYAIKRLNDFDRRVRTAKGQDWKTVSRALENLTAGFDKEMEPESYLLGLMIRSAAACHFGDTAEAARLNHEAEAFAVGKPEYTIELLRIQIEQLVILQDIEDFDDAERLYAGVAAQLERFAEKTGETSAVRDLRMRFNGTMGQVFSAIAVSGRAEYVEKARMHSERAYEIALGLWRDAKAAKASLDEQLEALSHVVQDANYRVMWSAFNDFASLEERADDARGKAARLCAFDHGDSHEGSERCRTNAGYRERFRLMGWYREMLKGKSVGALWGHVDDAVLDDDKAEDWARALCCKYLGALEAASGECKRAFRLFKKAVEIINEKEGDFNAGILGMIHMTVLAETFHSLSSPLFSDQAEVSGQAEVARSHALALISSPRNVGWHAEAWKEYLEHPNEKPYPALTYWY